MNLFLSALALACLMEGLPYLAAPGLTRRAAAWLATRADGSLRAAGLALTLAALGLLAWARALGARP